MHPNLVVFLTSFLLTVGGGLVIWFMVMDKEQRMDVYQWIDKFTDKILAKLSRKAV